MVNGCDMRGYLSFFILWTLNKKELSGSEIAVELEKRKGIKPNPGTIYPVLKELKNKSLIIEINGNSFYKRYSLTKDGEKELVRCREEVAKIFYDFNEIVVR